MKFSLKIFVSLIAFLPITITVAAEDPSIDRLLRKLPPPEKIVRPGVQTDPASADPMAKEMFAAAKAGKLERALALSRRLGRRYPKSFGVSFVHGLFALSQQKFPEAEAAYRSAIVNQPNSAVAYVGLGVSEAGQQHYAQALSTFQKVTKIEPKMEVAWIASSECAGNLGRREESVAYARTATDVAPKSFFAWSQLAIAQRGAGDKRAAAKAQTRANQLRPSARSRPH